MADKDSWWKDRTKDNLQPVPKKNPFTPRDVKSDAKRLDPKGVFKPRHVHFEERKK